MLSFKIYYLLPTVCLSNEKIIVIPNFISYSCFPFRLNHSIIFILCCPIDNLEPIMGILLYCFTMLWGFSWDNSNVYWDCTEHIGSFCQLGWHICLLPWEKNLLSLSVWSQWYKAILHVTTLLYVLQTHICSESQHLITRPIFYVSRFFSVMLYIVTFLIVKLRWVLCYVSQIDWYGTKIISAQRINTERIMPAY